jgi:hypothetical protein
VALNLALAYVACRDAGVVESTLRRLVRRCRVGDVIVSGRNG